MRSLNFFVASWGAFSSRKFSTDACSSLMQESKRKQATKTDDDTMWRVLVVFNTYKTFLGKIVFFTFPSWIVKWQACLGYLCSHFARTTGKQSHQLYNTSISSFDWRMTFWCRSKALTGKFSRTMSISLLFLQGFLLVLPHLQVKWHRSPSSLQGQPLYFPDFLENVVEQLHVYWKLTSNHKYNM